jgi:hypothetical protein
LQLLDAIKVGAKKEFGTTLAVYERIIGPGKVADLFAEGQLSAGPSAEGEPSHENTVSVAQQVMHENTTQLDAEEQMAKNDSESDKDGNRGLNEEEGQTKGKKRNFFARMLKK